MPICIFKTVYFYFLFSIIPKQFYALHLQYNENTPIFALKQGKCVCSNNFLKNFHVGTSLKIAKLKLSNVPKMRFIFRDFDETVFSLYKVENAHI